VTELTSGCLKTVFVTSSEQKQLDKNYVVACFLAMRIFGKKSNILMSVSSSMSLIPYANSLS